MIPKTIHYCWFGKKPLPKSAKKCIKSWRKYFPDYEIKEWSEDNFDVNIVPYTSEAYEAKKYAFVSDYARLWILYHYGGVYFDTDVEVIRPMDDIIKRGPFMGCENEAADMRVASVAPGLGLGVHPRLGLYKDLLDYYSRIHYKLSNDSHNTATIVTITTNYLVDKGLKAINSIQEIGGVYIYPKEYFCPKDYVTGKMELTKNTYSIHHYDASWLPWYVVIEHQICYGLHLPCYDILNKLFYSKTFWKRFRK